VGIYAIKWIVLHGNRW